MTDEWLSLSDAAKLLGVHPSTVRLWSDKSILPVHRTAGGHRRYRRADVDLWAEHARHGRVQPEALMQSAVRNVRLRIAEGQLEAEAWYQKLDDEARTQYRRSAHLLFQGLMSFLSASTEHAGSEAHAIGFEYASRGHRHNLNYVETAQAFLFFRNVLSESFVLASREANVPFDQILQRMQTFTDEILVSLLETYQKMEAGNK